MTPTTAIKAAAVFVPSIGPLEPDIVAALALVAKLRVVLVPMLNRIEAGEPAFIEAAEEAPQVMALASDFAAALRTYDRLMAIEANYAAQLAAATKA
jgi:hypothetical protein